MLWQECINFRKFLLLTPNVNACWPDEVLLERVAIRRSLDLSESHTRDAYYWSHYYIGVIIITRQRRVLLAQCFESKPSFESIWLSCLNLTQLFALDSVLTQPQKFGIPLSFFLYETFLEYNHAYMKWRYINFKNLFKLEPTTIGKQ